MDTRQRPWLVLALLLIPTAARADRHNWDVSAMASSSTGGSLLWGGSLSGEKTIHRYPKVGVFLDLAKYSGPHDGGSLTRFSALAGPRLVFYRTVKKQYLQTELRYRLQFFGHLLGGIVQTTDHGTTGAGGVGGGVDGLFSDYGGVRAQVDHVWFSPEVGEHRFFRFSLGVTYRFEYKHH
jgi:hypothetical protein